MEVKFKNPYWSDKLKLEVLQRMILVHCNIYYLHDDNILTDLSYDELVDQYFELLDNMPRSEFKRTMYYYAFKGFHRATGFDLVSKLNKKDKDRIEVVTNSVLFNYENERRKKK